MRSPGPSMVPGVSDSKEDVAVSSGEMVDPAGFEPATKPL